MHYTVYRVTNLVNGRIYIGIHRTKDLEDAYMGSGKLIIESIKKRGIEQFKKDILFDFDNEEDMIAKEKEIVNSVFVESSDTYNMTSGGYGGSPEACSKGGLAVAALSDSPQKRALRKHNERVKSDPVYKAEINEKIRLKSVGEQNHFFGRTHSAKTKALMSSALKGRDMNGSNNPAFGTVWISNIDQQHSKRAPKADLQKFYDSGWIKGRKFNAN